MNADGDEVEDTDNAGENILLMRGDMTGVLIAAGDGDFGSGGGVDRGIARVGSGGASIGDVMVTARLETFGSGDTAGQGFVIAAGIIPKSPGVYAASVDGEQTINPTGSRFVGSSIGAIDFTDTDEVPSRYRIAVQPGNPQRGSRHGAPSCHPGDHLRCNREC